MKDIFRKWLKYLQKRLKYARNDINLWEIAKICGKWIKYLINHLINSEMTQRFGKQLKYFGNGLDLWGIA